MSLNLDYEGMTDAEIFEKKFVEIVLRFVNKKKWTKKHVSDLAWPEQAKPDNKYQRIEKGQKVNLADAYALSNAIGYEFEDLVLKVLREMKDEAKENPTEIHQNSA